MSSKGIDGIDHSEWKMSLYMNIVFIVIGTLILWTACHSEYVVIYATSIAQLSIWITAVCLVDFWSVYISLMCNKTLILDPKDHPLRFMI